MSNSQNNPLTLIQSPQFQDRPLRVEIRIQLTQKRFAPGIPAQIRNLSEDGAFIETIPERPGRLVDLIFGFPGNHQEFHITSRITWCRRKNESQYQVGKPIGMGVHFVRFLKGNENDLKAMLDHWNRLSNNGFSKDHVQLLEKPLKAEFQSEHHSKTAEVLEVTNLPENFQDWEIEKALEFLSID